MKVSVKYLGEEILSFDTYFDPGFGHLMVVLGCLLDGLAQKNTEILSIDIMSIEGQRVK